MQPPRKKLREYRSSSESFIPSDPSDQSGYNQRTKTDMTTNACAYELLRYVTELFRIPDRPGMYLEWSITHDTFVVQPGNLIYSTTNDGSLVQKGHRGGFWERASKRIYCSIEVKSWHDVESKSVKVQAQEAAHLIAMYAQQAFNRDVPDVDIVYVLRRGSFFSPLRVNMSSIPLVSMAQNAFSVVFGRFPPEYARYLYDGDQIDDDGVFVEVTECGMFDLQKLKELFEVLILIISLHLWLQDGAILT